MFLVLPEFWVGLWLWKNFHDTESLQVQGQEFKRCSLNMIVLISCVIEKNVQKTYFFWKFCIFFAPFRDSYWFFKIDMSGVFCIKWSSCENEGVWSEFGVAGWFYTCSCCNFTLEGLLILVIICVHFFKVCSVNTSKWKMVSGVESWFCCEHFPWKTRQKNLLVELALAMFWSVMVLLLMV